MCLGYEYTSIVPAGEMRPAPLMLLLLVLALPLAAAIDLAPCTVGVCLRAADLRLVSATETTAIGDLVDACGDREAWPCNYTRVFAADAAPANPPSCVEYGTIDWVGSAVVLPSALWWRGPVYAVHLESLALDAPLPAPAASGADQIDEEGGVVRIRSHGGIAAEGRPAVDIGASVQRRLSVFNAEADASVAPETTGGPRTTLGAITRTTAGAGPQTTPAASAGPWTTTSASPQTTVPREWCALPFTNAPACTTKLHYADCWGGYVLADAPGRDISRQTIPLPSLESITCDVQWYDAQPMVWTVRTATVPAKAYSVGARYAIPRVILPMDPAFASTPELVLHEPQVVDLTRWGGWPYVANQYKSLRLVFGLFLLHELDPPSAYAEELIFDSGGMFVVSLRPGEIVLRFACSDSTNIARKAPLSAGYHSIWVDRLRKSTHTPQHSASTSEYTYNVWIDEVRAVTVKTTACQSNDMQWVAWGLRKSAFAIPSSEQSINAYDFPIRPFNHPLASAFVDLAAGLRFYLAV